MPVRAVPVRPPSFRSEFNSGRDDCSAGVRPNSTPTTIVAANANSAMRQSSVTSASRGRFSGARPISSCSVQRGDDQARARRRRAPARRFRSAAAASSGRGRRRAPCAPPARGGARRRARSAGPATFAHAISSTKPTAPSSTSIAVRTSATMLAASGSPSIVLAGVGIRIVACDPIADRLQLPRASASG